MGRPPVIRDKVMDYFVDVAPNDISTIELARVLDVGLSSIRAAIRQLITRNIIYATKVIGNTQYFALLKRVDKSVVACTIEDVVKWAENRKQGFLKGDFDKRFSRSVFKLKNIEDVHVVREYGRYWTLSNLPKHTKVVSNDDTRTVCEIDPILAIMMGVKTCTD